MITHVVLHLENEDVINEMERIIWRNHLSTHQALYDEGPMSLYAHVTIGIFGAMVML